MKSDFRSLLVQVNWISRLRDIRQNVQVYTDWNRFLMYSSFTNARLSKRETRMHLGRRTRIEHKNKINQAH